MSFFALTNALILGGAYDLSGFTNSVGLSSEVMELDSTNFRSGGAKERKAGLWTSSAQVAGYMSTGSDGATPSTYGSEDAIEAVFAAQTTPWTFSPDNTVGTVSYFTKGMLKSYGYPQTHGELAAFNLDIAGNERLVRGFLLHAAAVDRTSTGAGSAVTLPAVTSGQTLYAAIHVVAAFGATPSLTVKIQRDDNSNFTSATDVLSFTAATSTTAEWKTDTNTSSDTYYRVHYTISGTDPHFYFAVSAGIA